MKTPFITFIFYMFAGLMLLTSCKKDKNEIIISGKILDSGFGNYLVGATVKLSGNGIQNGIYSPDFVELETITTDAGGNFSFTRTKDRSDSFRITVTKNEYFSEVHEFSSTVFSASSEYVKEIQIKPSGYLQIHFYNAYPSDDDDQVVFYFSNAGQNCPDCCTNTPHTGYGPAFDTTFTCRFYGNQKICFLRSVTKNQHTNVYLDSLFCPAFETTTYQIPY